MIIKISCYLKLEESFHTSTIIKSLPQLLKNFLPRLQAIITLTKVKQDIDKPGRDRPVVEHEIIITPAMIEAGLAALHRSGAVDYETSSNAYVVRDVLSAVLSVGGYHFRAQGGI